MVKVTIPKHRRRINGKWKDVKGHNRTKRPKSKKRIIDKNTYLKSPGQKMVRVKDGNGQYIGWKIVK